MKISFATSGLCNTCDIRTNCYTRNLVEDYLEQAWQKIDRDAEFAAMGEGLSRTRPPLNMFEASIIFTLGMDDCVHYKPHPTVYEDE